MLRGLQGERVRQAFLHFDGNKDGYIEPSDFQRIIRETASHKLSDYLLENLTTLCNISAGSKISYANVRAFQNMIQQMDMVELIVRNATQKSSDGKITRTDFLNEAARISRFNLYTPMEADILFHFAGLDEPSGRLSLKDLAYRFDSWNHRNRRRWPEGLCYYQVDMARRSRVCSPLCAGFSGGSFRCLYGVPY
jgi:solute carrier family 25 aspartate/glutamate transporter 12/13